MKRNRVLILLLVLFWLISVVNLKKPRYCIGENLEVLGLFVQHLLYTIFVLNHLTHIGDQLASGTNQWVNVFTL